MSAHFADIEILRGQTAAGELVITNNDLVTGVQEIRIGDTADLDFTPNTFSIDVTGLTAIRRPFSVTAATTANLGSRREVIYWGIVDFGEGSVRIRDVQPATFTFTANPATVSAANGVDSAPVEFTLTSQNGFYGQVDITNETDGEVQEVPIVDPFSVTVTPTAPTTFTRRFIRFDGTAPLHVTYTATSGTITKTLTITVNHP